MKNKFIFWGIIFSILYQAKFTYAQTETITLNWQGVKTQFFEKDTIKYLHFENALFEIDKSGLPTFYKRKKIDYLNAEIKIELKNKIFEELSPTDINGIENIVKIKDDISIESYISIQEKEPYANVKFVPIKKNAITGKYEKLVSFCISIEVVKTNNKSFTENQSWADNSVLKEGKWYKIAVNKNGIYKLTYEQLTSMGLDITDPRKIRIYGNGGGMLPEIAGSFRYDDLVENAIYVEGEGDGSFDSGDYVLFYGESQNTWYYDYSGDKLFHHKHNIYSDNNYYFINADLGIGKRISPQYSTSDPANKTVSDFDDYAYHENDSINFLSSGKDWFGERFDIVPSYNYYFSFPDIKTSDLAYIRSNVLTHASTMSFFNFTCSNMSKKIYVPGVTTKESYLYANTTDSTMFFYPNSSNLTVNVVYSKPNNAASGYMDYIEISVRRYLSFSGSQLIFRDKNSIGINNVSDFILTNASSELKIWDITNLHDAKNQEHILNGNSLSFRLHTDTLREFIAFNGSSFYSPTLIGNVENQNLHNLTKINFIIVTPSEFLSEANRLAEFHRTTDNMSVVVATTEQIYNEFSSGKQDVSAIRNFAKMLYDKSSTPEHMPKNLLLLGDASYDYKNRITNNTNFVPTFESAYSLDASTSFVTDDFFGLLDNNEGRNSVGDLDIGVGRLPVKTFEEAKNVVDKIFRYSSKTNLAPNSYTISNFADWRNTVCFVADDGEDDGTVFMDDVERLSAIIDNKYKNYTVDKIYLDAFQQLITPGGPRYPDVNQAINKRVLKGALIVNYVGHSGELGWTLERVLGMSDINSWKNKYNMPFFISASCSFGRYDEPALTSAGEMVFLNSNGGGIAVCATSRLAYDSYNQPFLKCFYDTVFEKPNNSYYTMGELIKISKVNCGSTAAMNIFVFMGDPALKLSYPQNNIITTKINNDSIHSSIDTIKALSLVTINGYVADDTGNKNTSFNGKLYPTVYDKFLTVKTFGNDPNCAPIEFAIRKNILYKGKVSVKNGDFEFKFIVPKDINYTFGYGKISYYAENGTSDAAGNFDNFLIGGSETNYTPDNQGPKIDLFLNDDNFKFGGITDENPFLLSFLFDDNGINTVGNGVGHDIIAVLDDNNQNPFILNDYYQANLDSYQSGSIIYPFINLDEGTHKLKLRAWDIYNNSSEAYTEFIVSKSAKIALKNILNYPNPFTDKTTFRFEHNQSDANIEVIIQIFSITGGLVKTIEHKIQTTGYLSDQINWDGSDESGKKIGAGVYVYKIKIGNQDKGYIEKSQKLVLIK